MEWALLAGVVVVGYLALSSQKPAAPAVTPQNPANSAIGAGAGLINMLGGLFRGSSSGPGSYQAGGSAGNAGAAYSGSNGPNGGGGQNYGGGVGVTGTSTDGVGGAAAQGSLDYNSNLQPDNSGGDYSAGDGSSFVGIV